MLFNIVFLLMMLVRICISRMTIELSSCGVRLLLNFASPRLARSSTIDTSTQVLYYKHKLSEVFSEYFTLNLSVHNYTTRARYDLQLPSPYSSTGKDNQI